MDDTHQAKLANQSAPGIWIGFAEGHPTSMDYYTHSPFPPFSPGVFKRNDYKYCDFGVLVDHLADPNH